MEGRGALTISTRRGTLREHEIGQCHAGEYLCLSVADTGCGMTQDVLARVFEPFYTTKAIGKGTGLGLSQIFGFVSQCRGEIHIDSAPGEGTNVQIYIPRDTSERKGTASELQRNIVPQADPADEALIPLNILVVEDDARVLGSTIAALKALGHSVVSCDHPAKAGDALAAAEQIDLILSDVLMPDMTGPEMVAALKAEIGDTPVIFVTGFAGDGERAAQLAGSHVLRKPFTIAQLARAIGQATRHLSPDHAGKGAAIRPLAPTDSAERARSAG
jgi:CheY-like chemotaxis protein